MEGNGVLQPYRKQARQRNEMEVDEYDGNPWHSDEAGGVGTFSPGGCVFVYAKPGT